MQRLMIVDTSDAVRKVARKILSGLDYTVLEAEDAGQALARCRIEAPDIVIVDAAMEGALELIGELKAGRSNGEIAPRIYYCVIDSDFKRKMAGKRAGADDFLMKPFDRRSLTACFGTASAAA